MMAEFFGTMVSSMMLKPHFLFEKFALIDTNETVSV